MLGNRCVLQQQHVDCKIADALLKKGTKQHADGWDASSKDWAHMVLHLSHAEETANGHLSHFFIVYVANSKVTSKGSNISERAPLMKSVPLDTQWNFVTQTDKEKLATFALISLYHYRNIPESLRQTMSTY
jgi:hypothetical protein